MDDFGRETLLTKWWNLPLGIFLLLVPFIAYLNTSILWFIGYPLTSWSLLVGVVGACLFLYFFRDALQLKRAHYVFIILAFLVILLFGVGVSAFIYDYAYDGMLYHQPIIYSLMEGWNPVYETSSPHFKGEYISSFVDYYPKGLETMAAIFAKAFRNIEVGKVVNFLFLSSSFCLSFFFVKNYCGQRFVRWKMLLFSFLMCYSPVTIVQLCTFYVDWSMYFIVLSLMIILYDWVHTDLKTRKMLDCFLIGILVAMAASIKITVMFWSSFIFLALVVFWRIYLGKVLNLRNVLICAFVGGTFGFVVLAFNPYMRNVMEDRCLFHPFLGSESVDVGANQEIALEGVNRAAAVCMSLFSRPSSNQSYKGPFSISLDSAIQSGKAEVKLGGFGLFFIEILLLGSALFFLSYRRSKEWFLCFGGLCFLIVFLLFFPNGWWARFNPYFYFFPLICLFYQIRYGKYLMRKMTRILIVFMVFNVAIIQGSAMGLMLIHRSKVHYLLDVLEVSPQPVRMYCKNWALQRRMDERNIGIISCDTLNDVLVFPGSPVRIDVTEWREDKVDKKDYFLLRYSNIKNSIIHKSESLY